MAVLAFGATIFYALQLVVVPLAAAALTFLLFALTAVVVVMVFLARDGTDTEEEEDEPAGLGQRAYTLFRQRPILGTVAALAGVGFSCEIRRWRPWSRQPSPKPRTAAVAADRRRPMARDGWINVGKAAV